MVQDAGHDEEARLRHEAAVHLRRFAEPEHRQPVCREVALEVAWLARVDLCAGERGLEIRRPAPQRGGIEREHGDVVDGALQREEGRHERRLGEIEQPRGRPMVLHQRQAAQVVVQRRAVLQVDVRLAAEHPHRPRLAQRPQARVGAELEEPPRERRHQRPLRGDVAAEGPTFQRIGLRDEIGPALQADGLQGVLPSRAAPRRPPGRC